MIHIRAINDWLAIHCTMRVATMGCVWLFLLWSILPLIWPATRDTVFYVSGGILQLVLLPLIMVGQAKLSAASDEQRAEDHVALLEILADMREEHDERHKQVMDAVK